MTSTNLIKLQKEFLNTIENELSQIKTRAPSSMSDQYLRVVEDDIITSYNEAKARHNDLISKDLAKKPEIAKYIEENVFTNIRNTYLELRGVLQECQTKSAPKLNDTLNSSVIAPPKQQFDLRLPVIELTTFDGDYNSWLDFNSDFNSTVHNSSTLEDIQKMKYLRSCLKGHALNVIKDLEISDKNYPIARKLLSDRYHHARRLVNEYLRRLYEYPPLKSETSTALKQLLDNINDCQTSLTTLESPITGYHFIYHMIKKLPTNTATAWEQSLGSSTDIPTLEAFKDFIEKRYRVLEMTEVFEKDTKKSSKTFHTKLVSENPKSSPKQSKNKYDKRNGQKGKYPPCVICTNSYHSLFNCKKFLTLNVNDKWLAIQNHKQCCNCLGNHLLENCKSSFTCKICNERHHTFLHIYETSSQPTANSFPIHPPMMQSSSSRQNTCHMTFNPSVKNNIFHTISNGETLKILGTANVTLINTETGQKQTVRALIDSCSEESYITECAANALNLPKLEHKTSICTFGGAVVGATDHCAQFKVRSINNGFEFSMTAAIAPEITSDIPSVSIPIPIENVESLKNLTLADPTYFESSPIHILLGVGPSALIKKNGIHRLSTTLIAQNTKLGYVIEGEIQLENRIIPSVRKVLMTKSTTAQLQSQIQRFWEIEEILVPSPISPEDTLCEKLFNESVNRRVDGRLAVDLPFRNDSLPPLGISKPIAIKRFLNLEKKLELSSNSNLRQEYHNTISDYIKEGHLLLCEPSSSTETSSYFIPHHAVLKSSSTTTKVRVVFDASCRTSNGTSLNSHLLSGPRLQTDIRNILCNWRKYPIALTADVAKMFRMFWVNEKHRPFQKIIWRVSPQSPLEEYMLATITFGTSSAPYQAIRCMNYIADENSLAFPLAAKTIKSEFYVDDCITGAYSETEAIEKINQLRTLLESYGLNLRKWSSNMQSILSTVPLESRDHVRELTFDESDFKKTLGIFWSPVEDSFSFFCEEVSEPQRRFTKREVLSLIARLYDPLGWVAPCTMYAKLFMQRIWKSKENWDEEISEPCHSEFMKFLKDLHHLNRISIPRWINTLDDKHPIKLLGFCDASESGYGAVLYLLDKNGASSEELKLLTSRTRCCDLKYESIARWELNGALLLVNLLDWALNVFKDRSVDFEAFSDSKIVLAWLNADPSRWKPYVANRTQKILKIVNASKWRYVPTAINPADLSSRGLLPSKLVSNTLWWRGPCLKDLSLSEDTSQPLSESQSKFFEAEIKKQTVLLCTTLGIRDYINKCSDHYRLVREIRVHSTFFLNIIDKILQRNPPQTSRWIEIRKALLHPEFIIFRLVQKTFFPNELKNLNRSKPLQSDSTIKSMNPFIDGYGVLRVGGRLDNAELPYSQKHPIILPGKCQVTINLIKDAHLATDHGGNLLTEYYLKSMYYIPRMSDRVRNFIHHCVKCNKFAKLQHEQLMGSLPYDRVNPCRAITQDLSA